jgi:hypothetical protein
VTRCRARARRADRLPGRTIRIPHAAVWKAITAVVPNHLAVSRLQLVIAELEIIEKVPRRDTFDYDPLPYGSRNVGGSFDMWSYGLGYGSAHIMDNLIAFVPVVPGACKSEA